MDSTHVAKPDHVFPWETFEAEVAASTATVDNSHACHRPVEFRGRVSIEVTA